MDSDTLYWASQIATHLAVFGFGYVVASRAWRKEIERSFEQRIGWLEREMKGGDGVSS